MKIRLNSIDLDASIQCRASIDTATLNEYAERMTEGDKFPPVVLFGTKERSWIGDGWHRVMAARQIDMKQIDADLRPGGRIDALKCALSSNAGHGLRRTNADKRRCVELAVGEFPKLSSRVIAEMCGVSPAFVDGLRPEPTANDRQSKRTGRDGKERPAHREPSHHEETEEARTRETHQSRVGPPQNGMQFARLAIMRLEEIREDDVEREQAFAHVKGWLEEHGT